MSKSEYWNSREQRLSYEWVSKEGVRGIEEAEVERLVEERYLNTPLEYW